jgi:hypothetical protein
MRSLLSALAVLVMYCSAVLAYTEAPAQSFTKPTADGRFVFVMLTPDFDAQHATAEEKALRRKYPTGGLYANDGTGRRLWAVDWYGDNVHPVSDGAHVARVHDIRGYWLGGESRREQLARVDRFEALALYDEGRLVRSYTLGELIDTSRFTDGQLNTWFRWLHKAELDEAAGTVVIEAITGERVAVDYRSGEVISRDGEGVSLPQGGRWWVAVAVGVGVVAFLAVGIGIVFAAAIVRGRRAGAPRGSADIPGPNQPRL